MIDSERRAPITRFFRLSNLGKATILNNGSTQHFMVDVTGYFE
jgi:hypothetical protein